MKQFFPIEGRDLVLDKFGKSRSLAEVTTAPGLISGQNPSASAYGKKGQQKPHNDQPLQNQCCSFDSKNWNQEDAGQQTSTGRSEVIQRIP